MKATAHKSARATTVSEEIVVLEMSPDEANFLRDVLDHIGGDPATSRRRHCKSIQAALSCLGRRIRYNDTSGGITFQHFVSAACKAAYENEEENE